MADASIERFIREVPKAELHLHIEGTLEPEMMFEFAARNGLELRFSGVEAVRKAYEFESLQAFLDIYYEGARVLLKEEDFYDLTRAYLERAARDGVRHAEIFFDPQTHTARGVPFGAVVSGIDAALKDAGPKLGLSSRLIMCFLRHLSAEEGMKTLKESLPFKDKIHAVGLDSSEARHPPSKFKDLFASARAEGFKAVAHAGEEGPPGFISEALDLLQVSRIDHGVRCLEDPDLVERLVKERVPLTVCPLSNIKLRVFDMMRKHNLKVMYDRGLCVTVNSDDPAYFGGYIADNFLAVQKALCLDIKDIAGLAKNSFAASFIGEKEKKAFRAEIDALAAG